MGLAVQARRGCVQDRLGPVRAGALDEPRRAAGGHRPRGRHPGRDHRGGGGPGARAGSPTRRTCWRCSRRSSTPPGRPTAATSLGVRARAARVGRRHDRGDREPDRAVRARVSATPSSSGTRRTPSRWSSGTPTISAGTSPTVRPHCGRCWRGRCRAGTPTGPRWPGTYLASAATPPGTGRARGVRRQRRAGRPARGVRGPPSSATASRDALTGEDAAHGNVDSATGPRSGSSTTGPARVRESARIWGKNSG